MKGRWECKVVFYKDIRYENCYIIELCEMWMALLFSQMHELWTKPS